MSTRESRAEALVALASIVVSVLFLVEGRQLKPGVFEPIGPGAVPMGVAAITIVLSLLVLFERWRTNRRAGADVQPPASDPIEPPEDWGTLMLASLCTLVYAVVLHMGVTRYGYATVVYLVVISLLLAQDRRQALPWVLALSVVFGLGLDYIFRYLLVADLP